MKVPPKKCCLSQFVVASLWFISVQRKSAVWHAWCKPQPTPLKTPHLIRICTSVGVFFTSNVIIVQAAFISLDSCVLQLILWSVIHLTLTVSQTICTILINCLQTHLLNLLKIKIRLNSALHMLILLSCFYSRTLSRVAVCWALKATIQMTFCRRSPISSACRVLRSKLYTVPGRSLGY